MSKVKEAPKTDEPKPSRQVKRAIERDFTKMRDRLLADEQLLLAVRVLQSKGFTPAQYEIATYLLAYMSKRVKNEQSK